MDNQINIQKENVLNAYKNGNQDQKTLLENLFGKDIFQPKDIKERVKTFQDAINILGNENQAVFDYYAIADTTCSRDLLAFAELRVIAEALNEGWEPTLDKDERRYYPWFYLYTQKENEELDEDEKKEYRVPLRSGSNAVASGGLVCAYAAYAGSNSSAGNGVRLVFKARELAEYCGKQFIDIWADFLIG